MEYFIEPQIETKIELDEDGFLRISQHDLTGEISYVIIAQDNIELFIKYIKKLTEPH